MTKKKTKWVVEREKGDKNKKIQGTGKKRKQ